MANRKDNLKHFIEEVDARFGKRYKFPNIKTEYKNSHSKLTVVCLKCGNTFTKIACDILTSSHGGCSCYRKKKEAKAIIPKEKVKKQSPRLRSVESVKSEINERYPTIDIGYSDYKNTYSTYLKCKCKSCGKEFIRKANTFLQTKNLSPCPRCKYGDKFVVKDIEDFLDAANKKHGGKYDYSKFVYTNSDTKGIVICHEKDKFGIEHGEFLVTPHAHIGSMQSGCPKCSNKHRYTIEEWKREAEFIHGGKYDYSMVTEYKGAKEKLPIICHETDRFGVEHGLFYISSNGHLTGQGCPKCATSHGEMEIKHMLDNSGFDYVWQYKDKWLGRLTLDFYIPQYKIGIECQGMQHYRPVKYWGGDVSFQKVVARDEKKLDLCKENNVTLLYYSDVYESENIAKNTDELLLMIQETIRMFEENNIVFNH